MASSRESHTVRIKDPHNSGRYFDIEILDALSFIGPNGQERLFKCPAATSGCRLTDETGDGMSTSGGSSVTRSSRAIKLRNPDDDAQQLDVEILESIGFNGPDGEQHYFDMPISGISANGDPNASGDYTRTVESNTFTNPNDATQSIVVEETTAIAYNGNPQWVLMKGGGPTQKSIDSANDPQPNTDPNPYLKFVSGKNPWVGPRKPVSQGLLWTIKDVHWGGAPIGVLQIDILWSSTGASSAAFPDAPSIAGLTTTGGYSASLPILDVIAYKIDDPDNPAVFTNVSSPPEPPYNNSSSSTSTTTAQIMDQGGFYFTPWTSGLPYPYGGTFTVDTVDGTVGIDGGPYGTPNEAAAHYFLFQMPVPGFPGENFNDRGGGYITWFGDIYGMGPDPYYLYHEVTTVTTTYGSTIRVLVFFDMEQIKAASPPSPSTFSFDIGIAGNGGILNGLSWAMTFSTYDGHTIHEFTADDTNTPTWTFSPISSAGESAAAIESIIPGYTVTFVTDLNTWEVTAHKEAAP